VDVGGVPGITISRGKTIIRPDGLFPAPPPRRDKTDEKEGHAVGSSKSFGVVYANDPARKAFETGAKFPVGSVIVREMFFDLEDQGPQVLAVMVKHAAGFNRAGGDWEFLLVKGNASEIIERQKKGSCLGCHASQREKDFVYPVEK